MSRKRRLRHLTRYVAAGAGIVTLAGTFLLAAAPAQAGTAVPRHGTHTSAAGTGKIAAPADKSAAQHYTNAGCNTASVKANYASCFAMVYTSVKNQIAASPDQPPSTALGPSDIQSAYKLP